MSHKLKEGERVICAYAESAAGPGWSNTPVWYIVRGVNGDLRQECLQPQDQKSDAIGALYRVSQEAHLGMTGAVRVLVEKR